MKKIRLHNNAGAHKPTHIGKKYLSKNVFFKLEENIFKQEEDFEIIDANSINDSLIVSFNNQTKTIYFHNRASLLLGHIPASTE